MTSAASKPRLRPLVHAALVASLTTAAISPALARSWSPLPPSQSGLVRAMDEGTVLYYQLTGRSDGSLWGTNPYTNDSNLATAAVHAGLLAEGETGVIKVTLRPGQASYSGSTAHGVTSGNYGRWDAGSVLLAADDGGDNPLLPDPGNLAGYRDGIKGGVYRFQVTGRDSGSLWGTNHYTDDSALGRAAVHAGVLAPGQTGAVRVVTGPGQQHYFGVNINGTASSGYGAWSGSYAVADSDGRTDFVAWPGMPDNPLTDTGIGAYRERDGAAMYFQVTGSSSGSLWGSNYYTDDSSLAKAAVHAGLLGDGQSGVVKVTIEPGQASYTGSSAHGVSSGSYGAWGGSFSLAEPDGLMGTIPMISSAGEAMATEGQYFHYQITAGPSAAVRTATGLPEGLSVDPATGVLSGTPRVSGQFPVQLIASNDWLVETGSGTSNARLDLTIHPGGQPVPEPTPAPITSDIERFFTWAESALPELFQPAAPATQTFSGYTYRYYSTTNSYLAVKNGRVYYIGVFSGGQLLDVGTLHDYISPSAG